MRLDLTQKSPTNSLLKSPPAKGCGRKVSNLGQNQGALALAQQHRPYPDGQDALELRVSLRDLVDQVNQLQQRLLVFRALKANHRRHQPLHLD